jgi:hypothetical protein
MSGLFLSRYARLYHVFNPNAKKLTFLHLMYYNSRMKKIILWIFVVVILSACGVKSDLQRPNPAYPRDYPVY